MSTKKEITISGTLQLLKEGLTRPEVAEHYGITMADCRRLFAHPKLKGKKALSQPDFVLVDDTVEEAKEEVSNVVEPETEDLIPEVEEVNAEVGDIENLGEAVVKEKIIWENN